MTHTAHCARFLVPATNHRGPGRPRGSERQKTGFCGFLDVSVDHCRPPIPHTPSPNPTHPYPGSDIQTLRHPYASPCHTQPDRPLPFSRLSHSVSVSFPVADSLCLSLCISLCFCPPPFFFFVCVCVGVNKLLLVKLFI